MQLLNERTIDPFKSCAMKWIRDIPILDDDISWIEIWENARRPFRCTKNKLRQFKILNRLYYTPSQLFKMVIKDNSKCIKCGTAEGTLLHLLWDCSKIKDLWLDITQQVMTNINIDIQ